MASIMTPEYHLYSQTQNAAVEQIRSLIPSFLENLTWLADEEGPLVIVEYGCADGANSQKPVRDIINKLYDIKGREIPIHIIHNDLPASNFSFLFSLVDNSNESYRHKDPGVFDPREEIYTFGSGTSFYRQVVSSGTVSLAFSSTAFHWQKERHFVFNSDTLIHHLATPEDNERWLQASYENFKTVLEMRNRELRVGGRLLLSHRSYSEEHPPAYVPMFRAINKILFQEIVDRDKLLTREEARACNVTNTIMSEPQILSLFPQDFFCLDGSKYGLKILQKQTSCIPDPYYGQYERGLMQLDEYAKSLARSVRAWFEPGFRGALPKHVNANQIVDYLFSRLQEEILKDPKGIKADFFQVYLILEKVARPN